MRSTCSTLLCCLWAVQLGAVTVASERELSQLPANTWRKLSPRSDTPPSPQLGYEGACVWDSKHGVLIRYGGHNQGGGGEQGSEIWTFDPRSARWTLMHPNTSPPGICCGQQNVFDPVRGRYIRFPAFSGSHGWQWFREIYLNDSSVWTYDLAMNAWRNMRPVPAPHVAPLRCASWDADHQVVVLFGGEGSREGTLVYDPYDNSWTWMNTSPQPEFRSGGNMAYDSHAKRHILFGAQFSDDPHTWAYDLQANRWQDRQPDTMPPTDRNDAVLCYATSGQSVVAIVKITKGEDDQARHRLETWSYRFADNRWTRMSPPQEPDASGNRARQLMYAPEWDLVLLENRTESRGNEQPEQQIWAYRVASAQVSEPPLAAPQHVRVTEIDNAAITLQWQPVADPRAKSLVVERAVGQRPWQLSYQHLVEISADSSTYRDAHLASEPLVPAPRSALPTSHSPLPAPCFFYRIRAVAADGSVGPPSMAVRSAPPLVEDVTVSVLARDRVRLAWKAVEDAPVAGYLVERAAVEVLTEDQLSLLKAATAPLDEPSVGAIRRIGPFVQLTDQTVTDVFFLDSSVDLSAPASIGDQPIYQREFGEDHLDTDGRSYRFAVFAYRVRAVNARGEVSGPSPAVLTIPPAPQYVFSREAAGQCELKWQPSGEQGIQGYRVYRMDGRYSDAKIQRLTPQPICDTSYTDPHAGDSTRRYYVVAVDAIGQEGFPSSPVWYSREWQRFYIPFTGGWHQ